MAQCSRDLELRAELEELLTCRSVEAEDVVQCGSPHLWDCHNIDDSEIDLPLNELTSPEPIGLGHLVNFGNTLLGETQQSEWTNAGKRNVLSCLPRASRPYAQLCSATPDRLTFSECEGFLGSSAASSLLQLSCVVTA